MSVRDEYIITRQGKKMVLYPGLLEEAHNQGLLSIRTSLLQIPTPDNGNVAICHATVTLVDEENEQESYDGIGDASPDNVGRNIVPHIIRMAETRAKARALRDAVCAGEALFDDPTPDEADTPPEPQKPRPRAEERRQSPPPPREPEQTTDALPEVEGMERAGGEMPPANAPIMTAQKRVIYQLMEKRAKAKGKTPAESIAAMEKYTGTKIDDMTYKQANDVIEMLVPSTPNEGEQDA